MAQRFGHESARPYQSSVGNLQNHPIAFAGGGFRYILRKGKHVARGDRKASSAGHGISGVDRQIGVDCSTCELSERIHGSVASWRKVSSMSGPSNRGSMNSESLRDVCSFVGRNSTTCLRLKASSCLVIAEAFSVVR